MIVFICKIEKKIICHFYLNRFYDRNIFPKCIAPLEIPKIPPEYEFLKNSIKNNLVGRIYSNFEFFYFSYSSLNLIKSNNQENIFETFLYDFLKDFKFIVYHFLESNGNSMISKDQNNTIFNPNNKTIICVEKKCIIIEQIDNEIINKIFNKMKLQKKSILRV